MFLIYAVSPLVSPLDQSGNTEDFLRAKDVSIFIINFLYQLSTEDVDKENSQPEDENVIVKKKRAVVRKFDKSTIAKVAHISHVVTMELIAFSELSYGEQSFADSETNPKPVKDFRPLFSGVSPPIA